MNKINIGNLFLDNIDMQETLDAFEEFVRKREPGYVTNVNVDTIVRYNRDEEFADFIDQANLRITDGVPILWAAKYLGTPIKAKVSGSDLVPIICALANQKGYKIFFLGGRPGAADAAKDKLLETLGHLKIVGTYAPPFGFEKDEAELEKIVSMIKEVRPDILFIGLGSPKQENWIRRYHRQVEVPVSMGVGVTFEFIASIVKRAPLWMQHAGLEWFWRLCMEPGRLWKRYLVYDMQFFWFILKQKMKK